MAASTPADAGMRAGNRSGDRGWAHGLGARIATAVVLGALAVAADWAGGLVFALFVLVLLAALIWEWTGLVVRQIDPLARAYRAVTPPGLLALMLLTGAAGPAAPAVMASALPIAALVGALGRDGRGLAGSGLWRQLAWLIWFGPTVVAALWLREAHGPLVLGWAFAVVWASDIGAFAVGRAVGGRKLAPRISPSKTVSGLLGGLAAAALVGLAATPLLIGGAPGFDHAALAVGVAAVGVVGDLAQSALKRRVGVKDSGGLLPGHGGVFDRLDSMLFALPAFAVAAALLGWPS